LRSDDFTITRPFGGVIEKLIDGEGIGLHALQKKAP
jgi:hypothetical protein